MSGAGIVSIRLPRSAMETFETNALRAGIDKHEAARRLVLCLERLTDDQLATLPEPPRESDNPRLSLYFGFPHAEALAAVSRRTQLSLSCIVRRLVYGAVVTGSITVTQTGQPPKFPSTRVQHRVEESDYGSVAWIIVLVLLVAVVSVFLRYRWIRARRNKSRVRSPKLDKSCIGTNSEAGLR